MKIDIPIGSKIETTDNNTVRIKVPNTHFWVLGEKKTKILWNAYLIDPESNYKEIIKKNFTTKSFAIFSSVILKTPFPYSGKRAENSTTIKKFLKKINKTNESNTKSRRLQTNRKRFTKNESNLTKTKRSH